MEPRVGIAVFIFKEGKFLVGQRKGSHGEGSWSVLGGHMEYGETPEETAIREIKEECGLEIDNVRFGAVTNTVFADEKKHYVTLWMTSDWKSGEATILEPDKCVALEWVGFDSLPQPLFATWEQLHKSEFIDGLKLQLQKSTQKSL